MKNNFTIIFVSAIYLFHFSWIPRSWSNDNALLEEYSQNEAEFLKDQRGLKGQNLSEDLTQDLLSRLKEYKIIFVPGLFTSLYPVLFNFFRDHGFPLPPGLLTSFHDQIQEFSTFGLDFMIAPINTQNSCAENGKTLADVIGASSKKVILISHSKGGSDILHLLLGHKDIHEKVAGWVSFQSAFLGTKLAGVLPWSDLWVRAIEEMLKIFMGVDGPIGCLTTPEATRFVYQHSQELADIFQKIPVLAMGSWNHLVKNSPPSFFSIPNFLIRLHGGGGNDGLVELSSQCLTGMNCVELPNIDHAGPVMDLYPFKSLTVSKRLAMTHSLLNMLLQRIP